MLSKKKQKEKQGKQKEINELKMQLDSLDKKIGKNFQELNEAFNEITSHFNKIREERRSLLNEKIETENTLEKLTENEKMPIKFHKQEIQKAPMESESKYKDKDRKSQMEGKETRIIKHDGIEGISTPLDRLYELVMKNGKIKVSDAAKKFSVSEKQIDEWAQILESRGLIVVHYPVVGRPELRKK